MFYSSIAEVAQKGIPGSQRKKRQCWALPFAGLGVEPVYDLVGCAIAADGDKLADALPIGLARDPLRVARCAGLGDFDLNASRPQTFQSGSQQPAALAATGCWIHDG